MAVDPRIDPALSLAAFRRGLADVFQDADAEDLFSATYSVFARQTGALNPRDQKIRNEKIVWLLRNRGLIYSNSRKFDLAMKDFEICTQLDSRDSGAFFDKGQVLYEMQQWKAAINSFEEAIKRDRLAMDSLILKGDCELRILDYRSAAVSYSKALTLNQKDSKMRIPSKFSSSEVKRRKAVALCCVGWTTKDMKELEKSANEDPKYAPALYSKARLLMAQNKHQAAMTEFEKSFTMSLELDELERDVDFQALKSKKESPFLPQWDLCYKFAMCVKAFKSTDTRVLQYLESADKQLKRCKQYFPHQCSNKCILFQKARADVLFARLNVREGKDGTNVLDHFLSTLQSLEAGTEALLLQCRTKLQRGLLFLEKGKLSKAEEDIFPLLEMLREHTEPELKAFKRNLLLPTAHLKVEQDKHDEALAYLDSAIKQNFEALLADPLLWYLRARCLHALKDAKVFKPGEMEDCLEKALDLCGGDKLLSAKIKTFQKRVRTHTKPSKSPRAGGTSSSNTAAVSEEEKSSDEEEEEKEFRDTVLQYQIDIKEADDPFLDTQIRVDGVRLPYEENNGEVLGEWLSAEEAEEEEKEKNFVVNTHRCRVCFQEVKKEEKELCVHPLVVCQGKEEAKWCVNEGKILCSKCENRIKEKYQGVGEEAGWMMSSYKECFLCCNEENFSPSFSCSKCSGKVCESCISANLGKTQALHLIHLADNKKWLCFRCFPDACYNKFIPALDVQFRLSRGCFSTDNFLSGFFDLGRRYVKKTHACVGGEPLLKLVSCCMFISIANREEHRGMNYLMGCIQNLANFANVWEGWTLRLYYDHLSLLHQHPTIWSRLLHVMHNMGVQLVPVKWAEYSQEEGYHEGLVLTLARFLALADLGKTAKIVVVRDMDTFWGRLDRESIRKFEKSSKLYHRYTAGPVCSRGYKWPLWGGGLAVKHKSNVGRKCSREFRSMEKMVHTFADQHMRAPELLWQDSRISSQFKEKPTQIEMFPYYCDQIFLADVIFPLMHPSLILTEPICFPDHNKYRKDDLRPMCGDVHFDRLFPQPWNHHNVTWRRKQVAPILNWITNQEKTLKALPLLPLHSCKSLVKAIESFYNANHTSCENGVASSSSLSSSLSSFSSLPSSSSLLSSSSLSSSSLSSSSLSSSSLSSSSLLSSSFSSSSSSADSPDLELFLAKCRFLYSHSVVPLEAPPLPIDLPEIEKQLEHLRQQDAIARTEGEKEKEKERLRRAKAKKQREQALEEEKKRRAEQREKRRKRLLDYIELPIRKKRTTKQPLSKDDEESELKSDSDLSLGEEMTETQTNEEQREQKQEQQEQQDDSEQSSVHNDEVERKEKEGRKPPKKSNDVNEKLKEEENESRDIRASLRSHWASKKVAQAPEEVEEDVIDLTVD